MTPDTQHFLSFKQNCRRKRHNNRQLKETKKKRMQAKYEKLKENEAAAKRDSAKHAGTYQPGQNMAAGGADGYTEEDLNNLLQAAAARPNKRPRKTSVCPFCKKTGHTTKRSSACLFHTKRDARKEPVGKPKEDTTGQAEGPEEEAARVEQADASAAADLDGYEAMEINDDVSVDDSVLLYHDADTWSSDEEQDQPPKQGPLPSARL
jgi:hypothetical protein